MAWMKFRTNKQAGASWDSVQLSDQSYLFGLIGCKSLQRLLLCLNAGFKNICEGFQAPFRASQYFGRQWVQCESFYSGHRLFSEVGDDPIHPSAMSESGASRNFSAMQNSVAIGGNGGH